MNNVNSFLGTTATLHLVAGDMVIGLVTEVVAQGVLLVNGEKLEVTTFYPWHQIKRMIHVATVYAETAATVAQVDCAVDLDGGPLAS